MQRRIGFDIGDVMCPDLPKRRNPDGTYRLVPAFPDCLEILTEVGQVEKSPIMEGRVLSVLVSPRSAK